MQLRMGLLAGLLGLIAGCGSSYSSPSGPTPSTPPPAGGTQVSVVRGADRLTTTAYAPNPVTISVGGTMTWVNNDTTTHTSTGDDGSWNSTIAPGGNFSRTFTTAGSFPYHCTIHPNMIGTVVVQ